MDGFPIIVIIAALILVVGVLAFRKISEREDVPTVSSATKPEDEETARRKKILLVVGLAVLIAFGVAAMLAGKTRGGTDSGGSSGSSVAFFAVWMAIFVPLLVRRKRKQGGLTDDQKRVAMLLVGLTVALVLGSVVFWLTQGR